MGNLTMHYGRPTYTIGNGDVQVYSSVQGGHTTAAFNVGGKMVNPFFIAPWWNEAPIEGLESTMQVMRGDYFCFPFGINADPVKGVKHPLHGKTANDCWDFDESRTDGPAKTLTIRMGMDPEDGHVRKILKIVQGQPVIYINHRIEGYSGVGSVGTHPCIQCPDRQGAAFVDMTEPLAGFTPPTALDIPANRGYYLLKLDGSIPDRSKAPTVFGDTADLTRYPLAKGYEDAAFFMSDASKEFTFLSVSIPEAGYLYFQLKDPKVLKSTLYWMPNGGRHYAPLNGRVVGVIGVDEVTGYFFYGIKPSIDRNPLQEKGFSTTLDFSPQKPTDVRTIMGMAPIGKDFKGVKDIVRKGPSLVTVLGKGGERIDVPCDPGFLSR